MRAKDARLEKLSVEKGLLRETAVVQHQLTALLECDVMEIEPENEIAIAVFKLLVLDLLSLFQALNHGLINILSKTLFSIRVISCSLGSRPLLRIVHDRRYEGYRNLRDIYKAKVLRSAVP